MSAEVPPETFPDRKENEMSCSEKSKDVSSDASAQVSPEAPFRNSGAGAAWDAPPWVASPALWSSFLAGLLLAVRLMHFSDDRHAQWPIVGGLLVLWICVAVYSIWRICREKEPALYPRHGNRMFWITTSLWMVTIVATGCFRSIALYVFLGMIALLGQLSLILRLRASLIALLTAGVQIGFIYCRPLRDYLIPDFKSLNILGDVERMVLFAIIAAALLAYAFLMREFLPLAETFFFHATGPIQGHDRSKERLLRSILLRALKIYDADSACVARAHRKPNSKLFFSLAHSINWMSNRRGPDKPEKYGVPEWLDRHLDAAMRRPIVAYHASFRNIVKGIGKYESGVGPETAYSLLIVRTGPEIEADEQSFFVLLSKRRFAFWLSSQGLTHVFWSEVLLLLQWARHVEFWRKLMSSVQNLENYEAKLGEMCSELAPRGIRPLKADLEIHSQLEAGETVEGDITEPTAENEAVFVSTTMFESGQTFPRRRLGLRVLVNRDALIKVNDDYVAKARIEIRRFVIDLFRSPFLKILIDLHQHGERGAKTDRGQATLTYDGSARDRIAAFDEKQRNEKYEREHFKQFGFAVTKVSPIMRAWLPWLPSDAELETGRHICWESYLQPVLSASHGAARQTGACAGCPVIRQIKRHLKGEKEIARDPLPAPAPAGTHGIIRHFYLSCQLERLPWDTAVHRLLEEVEDRTTRMEKDEFARWLQSEAAAKAVSNYESRRATSVSQYLLEEQPDSDESPFIRATPVFQHLAEGAGRIFHADHILIVNVDGHNAGRLHASFQRLTLDALPEVETGFRSREWALLQQMRALNADYSHYFSARELLFVEDPNGGPHSNTSLDPQALAVVQAAILECETTGRAREWVATEADPGFWRAGPEQLARSKRVAISPIPTTGLALLICTGPPELWERQHPENSEQLVPRVEEMTAIHDMCCRMGNAFNGLGLSSQVYFDIHKRIKTGLHHELTHLFYPMTERAKFLEKFIDEGVAKWEEVRRHLRVINAEPLLNDWCAAISGATKHLVFRPHREIEAETRAFCLAASGSPDEDRSRWAMLAGLGLDVGKIPELERLRNLPEEQRRMVVECLWQLAHIAESAAEMKSALRHANRVFALPDNASDLKRHVNIMAVLRDALRGFSHNSTRFSIALSVPHDLTVELFDGAFAMMAQLLITNALEALTARPPTESPALQITARLVEDGLVFEVANRGEPIPAPERLFFNPPPTSPGGRGVGLTEAQTQARHNGGHLRYEYRDNFNYFTFTQQPPPE